MKEKALKILKEKYISICLLLIIIIFILLICISINILDNTEKNKEIGKYIQTNKNLEEKISSLNEQIKLLGKNDKQAEIKQTIDNLKKEEDSLKNQKQQLENEVNVLKSDIIKLKGEPKTYPAGHLTAGIDIPIGKYKIYGGSSNFVVYSAYGDLNVNIILGSGYSSVNEYIYTFSTGDKIEASSSFKLVAIE